MQNQCYRPSCDTVSGTDACQLVGTWWLFRRTGRMNAFTATLDVMNYYYYLKVAFHCTQGDENISHTSYYTKVIWWRYEMDMLWAILVLGKTKPLDNCEFCIQCPHLPKASCPDKATCIYSNYSSARSPIASTTHSSPPINVDAENLINIKEDTMLHAKYIILFKWCKWFAYI